MKQTARGFEWAAYVDAENSFGALVRTRFRCTGDLNTRRVEAQIIP